MNQGIPFILTALEDNFVFSKWRPYFQSMLDFFYGIPDDHLMDWALLTGRPNPSLDARRITRATAQKSGPNNRRTDDKGNDFWVEHEEIFG